jgi:hypothetical protein
MTVGVSVAGATTASLRATLEGVPITPSQYDIYKTTSDAQIYVTTCIFATAIGEHLRVQSHNGGMLLESGGGSGRWTAFMTLVRVV